MAGTPRQRKTKKSASQATSSARQSSVKATIERPSVWSRNLVVLAVMMSALGVAVYLLPCPIDPVLVILASPPVFEGPLAPNDLLQQTEKLLKGQIVGPEDITMKDGVIFTGTADGQIISIDRDYRITVIARLGTPPCGLPQDEHTCGRPLGMRFHNGALYVLDAYLGLYTVDVETGKTQELISTRDPIEKKPLRFLNDLDIRSDGMIYFSDSSFRWHRRSNRYMILENSNDARLFRYDPKTGTTTVLVDGLCFANGVQLSPDEDFLLVAETTYARIQKYHLKGPKKGTLEIFADNLPGLVDNVRPRRAGGYWVALALPRTGAFCVADFLFARPWLSRLATKLINPGFVDYCLPKYGLLIALDQDGHIIHSLHDTTGKVIVSASSVYDTGDHLYIGSYYENFIGKLSIIS